MDRPKSRRDEYSEASRRALLDSATKLFTERGFAATSLDEVAADARLTKGAVYHHFENKQALFEAVLDEVEQETVAAVTAAAGSQSTVWEGSLAGLDAFFERCLDPAYRRICFQEGPVAMGFARWWECGEQYEIGLIKAMVEALRSEGQIEIDDVDVLVRILFGSLAASALGIARAEDLEAERDANRRVVVRMLEGLRPASKDAGVSPARPPRRSPAPRARKR